MATRRDQLQSYQFLLQRVVSALVYRTTDPANSPFRKAGGAVFAGVMLSILALTVTAVIQFFTGAWKTEEWFKGGSIIMEEETGATYVIFPTDEQMTQMKNTFRDPPEQLLYPTANFASAALLAGTTDVIKVDQASLAGEGMGDNVPPRGQMVGIPGLPNSIPPAEDLLGPGWAVCSIPATSSDKQPGSLLMVGEEAKGTPVQNMKAYDESGEAILVKDPTSEDVYLIWNGYKHELADITKGTTALQMTGTIDLAPAVIKAIPVGDPLDAPAINGLTNDSSAIPGAKVGQTYRVGESFQVVLGDGVAPISELQAALLNLDTNYTTLEGQEALEVFNADKKYEYEFQPNRRDTAALNRALPFRIPSAASVDPNDSSCINFPKADAPTVFVNSVDVPESLGVRTTLYSKDGNAYADRVAIVPGRAMLVQTGSEGSGAIALITSDGCMFPFSKMLPGEENGAQLAVGGQDALTAFKYNSVAPVVLPPEIEALIPQGHELNPGKVALTTVAGAYTEEEPTSGQ